eukprot:366313-Chlamydomonas_euryale.AAC.2
MHAHTHICSIAVLCQLEGVFERVARLGARVVAVDERGQRRAQRTRERQLLGSFRMCARLRQLRQRLGAKSADEQAAGTGEGEGARVCGIDGSHASSVCLIHLSVLGFKTPSALHAVHESVGDATCTEHRQGSHLD